MTILLNRPTTAETTRETTAPREARPAVRRPQGSYTLRYDRPQAAARPEGSYVSTASQGTRARGSYTCTDGAAPRSRPEGRYTLRG